MIIGTVGHVDHGKTELIKALTGIDTDRLAEEKKRGLSIVLGFAFIDLPKSGRVGIVDVPGHEKFLKNMLTGVRGIDVGLLVVAADEGVMPQTREHFEILRLSKVNRMVVALTKIDIVDEEVVEASMLDIKDLLEPTPYAESPILKVSSVTNEGLSELKNILDDVICEIPKKEPSGIPILPIDRSFALKGVGTVITGSLISGNIREGDEICIYPRKLTSRVRQIQVHNERIEKVDAGHRVALNLVGVKKDEIKIGDIISDNSLFTTKLIDAKLEPSIPIKNWTRVRIYILTGEFFGRIRNLAEPSYCQIIFEGPVVTWFGDTFILRSYSPGRLLGGGVVLNPIAKRHKRSDREITQQLKFRAEYEIEKIILGELKHKYLRREDLKKSLLTPDNRVDKVLNRIIKLGKVKLVSQYVFDTSAFKELEADITKELKNWHKNFPIKPGMPKDKLLHKMGLEPELFNHLVRELKELRIIGDTIALKDWKPLLTLEQKEEIKRIEKAFQAEISPPVIEFEKELLNLLIEEGKIVKVKADFLVHKDVIGKSKEAIREYIEKNGEITISEMKKLLGTTRKYAVPFAEYLDQIRFTKRIGDKRVLCGQPFPDKAGNP